MVFAEDLGDRTFRYLDSFYEGRQQLECTFFSIPSMLSNQLLAGGFINPFLKLAKEFSKMHVSEHLSPSVFIFLFALFLLIRTDNSGEDRGVCDVLLTGLSILLFICTFPLSLLFTLKVRFYCSKVTVSVGQIPVIIIIISHVCKLYAWLTNYHYELSVFFFFYNTVVGFSLSRREIYYGS